MLLSIRESFLMGGCPFLASVCGLTQSLGRHVGGTIIPPNVITFPWDGKPFALSLCIGPGLKVYRTAKVPSLHPAWNCDPAMGVHRCYGMLYTLPPAPGYNALHATPRLEDSTGPNFQRCYGLVRRS